MTDGARALRGFAAALALLLVNACSPSVSQSPGGADAVVKALAAKAVPSPTPGGADPAPDVVKETKPLDVQPDGSSVDAIVTALYASVSHGPEYEPNWTRLRALFLPKAIVVPPRPPDAESFAVLDPDGFEARIRKYIAGRKARGEPLGFTEREIGRRENRFGGVCQVFSAYETLRAPGDPKPFTRGAHSIQLVSDGRRWWIAALAWDNEREGNPIEPNLLAR